MQTWELRRRGTTLQVDAHAEAIDHVEEIATAVGRTIDENGIDVVRVTGRALEQPRRGLARLLRTISDVTTTRGKRFQIGPI